MLLNKKEECNHHFWLGMEDEHVKDLPHLDDYPAPLT